MLALAVIALLLLALAAAVRELLATRTSEAVARQQLADLRVHTDESRALVAQSREEFRDQMQAISSEVLQGAAAQVTRLTDQARRADHATASGEFRVRTAELRQAVAPVAEHLQKLEARVEQLQAERGSTLATMQQLFTSTTAELGRLRSETGTLVSALKRPQVRGSWGEIGLKNVARIAGMTEHVDFHTQASLDGGDDGRLRPDMTVHLPTGRDIVVDAKVPFDAYLAALEAPDDAARDRELDRHAAQLRTHLDTLAGKAYHAKLDRSAEFVVCFIPNEACYVAALDRDPSLLERGAAKHVLIATPTTLLALLHATHYGWRQAEVEQSALEIAAAGRELHKRSATFLEAFAKVGRQLGSATNAYNDAVGSAEGRVLPQLRRLESLGAKSEKELTVPVGVDTSTRTLIAGEQPPLAAVPERQVPHLQSSA